MTSIVRVGVQTDTELVAAALAGDQQGWNTLVDKYTRLVWHVVHGYHQLDAERRADVHQTVWLRLAEQLHDVRDPERVGGWLATTARRECLRQIAIQAREVPDSQIELEPIVEAPERHLLESERDVTLWEAFGRLRTECQQLLRLIIADPPFSYDEIAEILDLPRGSIGPTRQRCLDALRKSPGVASLEDAP